MKYDYDSYMLYEYSKKLAFTVRIRARLKDNVDGKILENAAVKAFKRFPYFNKKVTVDEEGGYILHDNDKPIVVIRETSKPVVLGGDESNQHFFLISYEDRDIFFNFSHSFCGGFGAMFWVKTTLWQYLSDKTGNTFNAEGIKLPGSPLEEGETALPDLDALPDDEPITEYKGGNSYVPAGDYLNYFLNPFSGDATYFPIEIDLKKLMSYAKSNDGSPNSIVSAFMFKALRKVWADNKKATEISARISMNYNADVNCPHTYRDLVRQLHVKYKNEMLDWPVNKISTVTRSSMFLQMEPEVSFKEYKTAIEYRENIDKQKTNKEKRKYTSANSLLRNGIRDSYTISYTGRIDWGNMGDFIESIHNITDGHLMIEMNAIQDRLFLNFQQVNKKRIYLDAFIEELRKEGIEVKVGEMQYKKLPLLKL
jgi:hypothetical protein